MNKTILVGRLTKDPDIRATQDGKQIARFTLAVDRRFKKDEADFISCVAFGHQAEFAEKYMKKGAKFGVIGRIQTGSYTNRDGVKVYTTDVIVEEQYFVEPKTESKPKEKPEETNGFISVPDDIADDLPFV